MRLSSGTEAKTLISVIGAIMALLVLAGSAVAAPSVKNEPALTQTTFSVPNESGEKGSGCPSGPFVQSDQFGGYNEPHSCPWSVTIKQSGFVLWKRAFSGEGKVEEEIGRDSFEGNVEASVGVISYPWSCKQTGRIQWTVEVWDDQGSGWSERKSGLLVVPDCIPTRKVFETLGKAQGAVIQKLGTEYVSRLRCSRRYFVWHCDATYNNTFRECVAAFRVVFYWGVEFGKELRFDEVERHRRRCTYF
jgi:hypothetical protein